MKQSRFIPMNPGLPLTWVLPLGRKIEKANWENSFLHGQHKLMTYSGSVALSVAAKGLKQIGRNHLLAPSYNCGHEIEPFIREKFTVNFYRIDKQGMIDLNNLESLLKGNHQIVLITHYFGFPNNVEAVLDLCRKKSVYLLEDCAHSFLSTIRDKYLGSWGDLAIFSLWKILPIPDGGCLVLNNLDIPVVPPNTQPKSMSVYIKTVKLFIEHLFLEADKITKLSFSILQRVKAGLSVGQAILRKHITKKTYTIDDESFDFDSQVLDWALSKNSLRILSKIEKFQEIKEKRRRNYLYVQDALSNLKRLQPLHNELPEGTCPLKFPLVPKEDHLNFGWIVEKYSPYIFRWWSHFHPSVPWKQFPESEWLKKNCFVLQIHQDMEIKHLDFLINCVLKAEKDMA